MKPLIGVTAFNSTKEEKQVVVNKAYINAITAAGGVPVILPNKADLAEDYLAALDGVLFTGGGDVMGKHFNQPTHELAKDFSEERDEFELKLAKLARAANKPVMGICRGEQLLNIMLGGDIIQHIGGHVQHDARNAATHKVDISYGSKLHEWLGATQVPVNSFHHQIVGKPADNVVISARSPEGYPEGWEYDGSWFCFGVQWHPEALLESPEHEAQMGLFRAFVEACRR